MANEDILPVLAREGELAVVLVDGQPVVTARALARALGYVDERSVLRIYNRNKDSFTDRDTFVVNLGEFVVNLTTNPQGGDPHVRVFTKRGALKVCMKSNQPMAVRVQEMLIDLYEAVEAKRLVPVEVLRDVERRLDELTAEVRRLALAQDHREKKVFFLPRRQKPWSTDEEAVNFLANLFAQRPWCRTSDAIECLRDEAAQRGWRIGSRATLYRIAKLLRR